MKRSSVAFNVEELCSSCRSSRGLHEEVFNEVLHRKVSLNLKQNSNRSNLKLEIGKRNDANLGPRPRRPRPSPTAAQAAAHGGPGRGQVGQGSGDGCFLRFWFSTIVLVRFESYLNSYWIQSLLLHLFTWFWS